MNAKLERVNKLECKADAEFDFIVVVGAVEEVAVELPFDISHGSYVGREGIHDQPGPGAIIVVLIGMYIMLSLSCAFRSES